MSEAIRCKFTCISVTKHLHWNRSGSYLYDFEFNPVTSGSEENKSFYEATPAGSVKLSTLKEDHFVVGKDYYLDIIPA